MKQKTYIFLFALVFLMPNTSCVRAEEGENLRKYFSKEEVSELKGLTAFFDSIVQQKTLIKNKPLAYKQFLKKLSDSKSHTEAIENYKFRFNNNQKIKNRVSSELFNKIWSIEKGYDVKNKDSVTTLNINRKNQYMKLLNSKSETMVHKYYEEIMNSGGISPSLTAILQHSYADLDFKDYDNRLIVAIHYITLSNNL